MIVKITHRICQCFSPSLGDHLVRGVPGDEGGEGVDLLLSGDSHSVWNNLRSLLLLDVSDRGHCYLNLSVRILTALVLPLTYPGDVPEHVGMEGQVVLCDVEVSL